MKKIFAALLAALMLFAVVGCAQSTTSDPTPSSGSDAPKKQLLVAVNAEFEPFESMDASGNIVGFDIDLMNALAEKAGYTVKYENMEFDGVIAAVAAGSHDASISGLTISPKRQLSVDFTDAYYDGASQILIVAKDDTTFTGQTKAELDEQLKGKTIGVCTGFTGQAYAQGDTDWGFPGIEGADVKIYENISLAIADIKSGTLDAVIMDDTPAKEAAKANADDVKVVDVALTTEEYAIAVAKTNPTLKSELNTALAALKSDGTLQKLIEKYSL